MPVCEASRPLDPLSITKLLAQPPPPATPAQRLSLGSRGPCRLLGCRGRTRGSCEDGTQPADGGHEACGLAPQRYTTGSQTTPCPPPAALAQLSLCPDSQPALLPLPLPQTLLATDLYPLSKPTRKANTNLRLTTLASVTGVAPGHGQGARASLTHPCSMVAQKKESTVAAASVQPVSLWGPGQCPSMLCPGVCARHVRKLWCRQPFPPGSRSRELLGIGCLDTGRHQCLGLWEKHLGLGLDTSDAERGAAQPRTPCPGMCRSFPHKRRPGVWLGARLAGPAGEVTLQFLRGHAEAPPQRSELSQPNSSPALSLPPTPAPRATCPSPQHGSHVEPPEACLHVHMSEVSWLDRSCREGGQDGSAGPSDPGARHVAQSGALVSVRTSGLPS